MSQQNALMMELVVMQVSKTCAERRVGSTPTEGTNGRDTEGRSLPLQGRRLGSIPTLSTENIGNGILYHWK